MKLIEFKGHQLATTASFYIEFEKHFKEPFLTAIKKEKYNIEKYIYIAYICNRANEYKSFEKFLEMFEMADFTGEDAMNVLEELLGAQIPKRQVQPPKNSKKNKKKRY